MLFADLTEVLDSEPHSAGLNMAIDEVLLLTSARTPLLRVYRWERPAISFGYFEKFAALGDVAIGREAVRRWTGGGVVLHGEDLTYTLVVPAGHDFARRPARESYRQIHAHLAAALRASGVAAGLAPVAGTRVSSGCFENPVEADVLAGSRKIAGAAQRRTSWGLLHQGSIQTGAGGELPLAAAFAGSTTRRALTPGELARAEELAAEKYGTDAWLRRF